MIRDLFVTETRPQQGATPMRTRRRSRRRRRTTLPTTPPAHVAELLDSAVKERLRAVLGNRPVTEAELRRLSEEGRACALILGAQLEQSEQRLAEVSADPTSSLAAVAAAFRDVNALRPDLEELNSLLDELHTRAREVRAAWVSTR